MTILRYKFPACSDRVKMPVRPETVSRYPSASESVK